MAVTDLTNTSWLFKSRISQQTQQTTEQSYLLTGTFYTTSYNGIFSRLLNHYESSSSGTSYFRIGSSSSFPFCEYYWRGGTPGTNKWVEWLNSSWEKGYETPTITITGGSDVTNATLIAWLQANATQIETGYNITYHANGGIPIPTDLTGQTNLPNPLPTVSKTNFTFDGWYTDSTFTTPAVAGAEISADTNLYAKFTRSHITLDLSTIGLPEGTHSVQMKLSDGGVTKRDSELSNAVSYTVAP